MLLDALVAAVISVALLGALVDLAADTVDLNRDAAWLARSQSALVDLEGRARIKSLEAGGVPELSGDLCGVSEPWISNWCRDIAQDLGDNKGKVTACARKEGERVSVSLTAGDRSVPDCGAISRGLVAKRGWAL